MIHIPDDQRFYLRDAAHLAAEIHRLNLELPVTASRSSALQSPVVEGRAPRDHLPGVSRSYHPSPSAGRAIPNRFCAQPIEGHDAEPDGSPSALTRRRYERLVRGGFGTVWIESTAVSPAARRHPRQLLLDESTLNAFTAWTASLRAVSDPLLILQLDHTAAPGLTADEARARFHRAAVLAAAAGFDGVDLRCDGDGLLWDDVLRHHEDASWLENIAATIHETCPSLILAVRLCAYDARPAPGGFGVDADDYRRPDPEPVARLAARLQRRGVHILNIVSNHPNLRGDPHQPLPPDAYPHEHPLTALARRTAMCRTLREAAPGLVLVMDGFSWLRQFMPLVAAGLVHDGTADLIGLGRFALAYPNAPADLFRDGELDPAKCCIPCRACAHLHEAGARVGCVLHDRAVYGAAFRALEQNAPARLIAEARRCHGCYPAPCTAATPGGLDIPAQLRALAADDIARAGKLLRKQQVLPEMCAELSPASASGENACIECAFSGRPVPIRDLHYRIALACRERGDSAVRIPVKPSGRHIAIVGGGPAGIAAAAVLLEQGHAVTLHEQSTVLGGVPERLIPPSRFRGAREEIDALLAPARAAARLNVHVQSTLGAGGITLAALRAQHDAVLLAAGLWRTPSLGRGEGVCSGLDFLEQSKSGACAGPVPRRIALLSGGDCAMDAACVARARGASQLYICFGGPRSAMLWCMEESWFAQPGIQLLTLTRPLGYRLDGDGRVTALHVARMELDDGGTARPAAGGEYTLPVDGVIEAGGLTVDEALRAALPGIAFTEQGLVARTTPDTFQTSLPGIFAAGALVNGGASIPRCVEEGMRAAVNIHRMISV